MNNMDVSRIAGPWRRGFAKKRRGFSLLELMVVLTIIGILMAIAIPGYMQYQRRSNRTAMQADLSMLATLLERRYTENGFYSTARGAGTCIDLSQAPYFNAGPRDKAVRVYTIAFSGNCMNGYTLRATPIGTQAGDGYLELTSTGAKRWDRNNSGSIQTANNEDRW